MRVEADHAATFEVLISAEAMWAIRESSAVSDEDGHAACQEGAAGRWEQE
jgi:hypothetical protein